MTLSSGDDPKVNSVLQEGVQLSEFDSFQEKYQCIGAGELQLIYDPISKESRLKALVGEKIVCDSPADFVWTNYSDLFWSSIMLNDYPLRRHHLRAKFKDYHELLTFYRKYRQWAKESDYRSQSPQQNLPSGSNECNGNQILPQSTGDKAQFLNTPLSRNVEVQTTEESAREERTFNKEFMTSLKLKEKLKLKPRYFRSLDIAFNSDDRSGSRKNKSQRIQANSSSKTDDRRAFSSLEVKNNQKNRILSSDRSNHYKANKDFGKSGDDGQCHVSSTYNEKDPTLQLSHTPKESNYSDRESEYLESGSEEMSGTMIQNNYDKGSKVKEIVPEVDRSIDGSANTMGFSAPSSIHQDDDVQLSESKILMAITREIKEETRKYKEKLTKSQTVLESSKKFLETDYDTQVRPSNSLDSRKEELRKSQSLSKTKSKLKIKASSTKSSKPMKSKQGEKVRTISEDRGIRNSDYTSKYMFSSSFEKKNEDEKEAVNLTTSEYDSDIEAITEQKEKIMSSDSLDNFKKSHLESSDTKEEKYAKPYYFSSFISSSESSFPSNSPSDVQKNDEEAYIHFKRSSLLQNPRFVSSPIREDDERNSKDVSASSLESPGRNDNNKSDLLRRRKHAGNQKKAWTEESVSRKNLPNLNKTAYRTPYNILPKQATYGNQYAGRYNRTSSKPTIHSRTCINREHPYSSREDPKSDKIEELSCEKIFEKQTDGMIKHFHNKKIYEKGMAHKSHIKLPITRKTSKVCAPSGLNKRQILCFQTPSTYCEEFNSSLDSVYDSSFELDDRCHEESKESKEFDYQKCNHDKITTDDLISNSDDISITVESSSKEYFSFPRTSAVHCTCNTDKKGKYCKCFSSHERLIHPHKKKIPIRVDHIEDAATVNIQDDRMAERNVSSSRRVLGSLSLPLRRRLGWFTQRLDSRIPFRVCVKTLVSFFFYTVARFFKEEIVRVFRMVQRLCVGSHERSRVDDRGNPVRIHPSSYFIYPVGNE